MPRILSIQSHVVTGHVGNRAAVFPLQRLGLEVDALHTVQFSNHTGHGDWTGRVFPPGDIDALMEGLAARGTPAQTDAVLTGYLGAVATGEAVLRAVAQVRAARPGALHACDPVMGDRGRGFFVAEDLPAFFRTRAVPGADIVTPNQFELEALTGQRVGDLASALAAARALRATGPKVVLITSLERAEAAPGTIEMLAVTDAGAWLVATPRLDLDPAPNGAGDATSALFLAGLLQLGEVAAALARTAAQIFAVFEATRAAGTRELALVQAQEALVAPPRAFEVMQVG